MKGSEKNILMMLNTWEKGVAFPASEEVCRIQFNLIKRDTSTMNPGEPRVLPVCFSESSRGNCKMNANAPTKS